MKSLKHLSAGVAIFLLLVAGCDKTVEVIPEDEPALKGKPVNSGYDLAPQATKIQVYGVWHAGNDYCTWASVRDLIEFDSKNRWIINRTEGSTAPSVNLVVLSFVNPLKLMNLTNDAQTVAGLPRGMTSEVVSYFTSHGIRVMLSIGGITYTGYWNEALAANPRQLAINAAAAAERLGVGIEIDYEENTNPNLAGLQTFIEEYRQLHPYDVTGENPAARLTIDLAAGDRWLIALCRKATTDWLTVGSGMLDYANAMVPARQPSAADALSNWYEHIEGKLQYAPPIPPLAPCKFTGSLYITGSKSIPECVNFYSSIQYLNRDFVTRIKSRILNPACTPGMLGYMFWAAECPSTRQLCTTGSNSCQGGIGAGADFFDIPVPMPPLRQN